MASVSTGRLNGLPSALSSFIGREREIDEIAAFLAVPATRLLTLTGAGGCGKTRLAIAVAQHLEAAVAFEHGAWFVDLAGLDTPSLVSQTITSILGLPETRDRSHVIDGKTTGALRASMGLVTTFADVFKYVVFAESFIDRQVSG